MLKRILCILVSLSLVLFTACSLAEQITEAKDVIGDVEWHNVTPPYSSTEYVKVVIRGLTDDPGNREDPHLPSEYHVRVKWDILNGIYSSKLTDSEEFQNYNWNSASLVYEVNEVETDGIDDVRRGNWLVNEPKVYFEVTNASTPDLWAHATAHLEGIDTWKKYMISPMFETQNWLIVNWQEIRPVLRSLMGTGIESYESGHVLKAGNVYYYTYEVFWDYNKLNQLALDLQTAGITDIAKMENTFVVTVNEIEDIKPFYEYRLEHNGE